FLGEGVVQSEEIVKAVEIARFCVLPDSAGDASEREFLKGGEVRCLSIEEDGGLGGGGGKDAKLHPGFGDGGSEWFVSAELFGVAEDPAGPECLWLCAGDTELAPKAIHGDGLL